MKTTNKVLLGLLAGAAVGTVITLLLTPKTGAELRKSFKLQGKKWSDDLKDIMVDAKEKFAEKREEFKRVEPIG
jgi:gas vesicle protein